MEGMPVSISLLDFPREVFELISRMLDMEDLKTLRLALAEGIRERIPLNSWIFHPDRKLTVISLFKLDVPVGPELVIILNRLASSLQKLEVSLIIKDDSHHLPLPHMPHLKVLTLGNCKIERGWVHCFGFEHIFHAQWNLESHFPKLIEFNFTVRHTSFQTYRRLQQIGNRQTFPQVKKLKVSFPKDALERSEWNQHISSSFPNAI